MGSLGQFTMSEFEEEDGVLETEEERQISSIRHRLRVLSAEGLWPQMAEVDDEVQEVDLNGQNEDLLEKEMDYIDLTEDDSNAVGNHALCRNAPLAWHQKLRTTCRHNGVELKRGTVVELREACAIFNCTFLEIVDIFDDQRARQTILRGLPYTRTKFTQHVLPHKRNEVVQVLEVEEEDKREWSVQGKVDVPLRQVLCARHLWKTNASFPEKRFATNDYRDYQDIENRAPLMNRWIYFIGYHNAKMRSTGRPYEWALIHLRAKDAPRSRLQVSDHACLNAWRTGKERGGSYIPGSDNPGRPMVMVDLVAKDKQESAKVRPEPGQRYTFGDMFCGAGGASRGAERAGFQVVVGVDHWPSACESYAMNFPQVVKAMNITDYIFEEGGNTRVDVLHLSPPCQFWSPAHTLEGVNDDRNIAALFACSHLVEKLRPRVFTLEQTFGILHARHKPFFNLLVEGFTSHGYSVRWGVIHLHNWGLPSKRKRLIMIGACPGETLPPFPSPTHGDARNGLQPYVTAGRALSRVNEHCSLHREMIRPLACPKPSWDKNGLLPRVMTCGGGQNYHYSGLRDFTPREYACLQGFPTWHRFATTSRTALKKQIGNAFPPCVVKTLYDHLRAWLEKEDSVVRPSGVAIAPHDHLIDMTDAAESRRNSGSDVEMLIDEDLALALERSLSDQRHAKPAAQMPRPGLELSPPPSPPPSPPQPQPPHVLGHNRILEIEEEEVKFMDSFTWYCLEQQREGNWLGRDRSATLMPMEDSPFRDDRSETLVTTRADGGFRDGRSETPDAMDCGEDGNDEGDDLMILDSPARHKHKQKQKQVAGTIDLTGEF